MKLLTKGLSITDAQGVTPQTISETDREAIDLVLDQLSAKKRQFVELDQAILAATTSAEDLEEEVLDTEMNHFELSEQIVTLKKFSSLSAQNSLPDVHTAPVQQTDMEGRGSEQQEPAQNIHQLPEHLTEPADDARLILVSTNVPVVSHTSVVHNVDNFVTRLLKLTLPIFSGDPLQFQKFWDSFEAAIHSNEGLTGVQKLRCCCSLYH